MSRKKPITESAPSLFRIVRRFWPYIVKRRWVILPSFLAMLGEVLFRVIEPWPLKFVFDRVISTDAVSESGFLAEMDSMTLLTVCAVALVVIVAARAVAAYLRRVGFALAGNMVLMECRGDLFSHLQRLSLSFHGKSRTGDMITRVTGDIGRLQEVVSTAALPLVGHALTVIAMAVIMLVMEWRLALVALAVLPLFWLSTKRIGSEIRSNARKQRKRHGELGAIAAEAIGSIGVVQSLSAESVHEKRFVAQNLSSSRQGVKGKRLSAKLLGTAEVLIAVGTAIVIWYGARLVLRNEMTAGDLIVFLAYLKSTTRPIRNLAKYSGRLAKASASAERVLEVLDAVPEIVDAPDATLAPTHVNVLAFEDVGFEYVAGRPVLQGIDLQAQSGQIIALTGPSGAGKSTLMNLLLRLRDTTSGRIALDGDDIRSYVVDSLRKRIAVVPQENVLFHGTIRHNITMGSEDVSDDRVRAAAATACAAEFIESLPDGYDSVVGEQGRNLSVGQRQRIALARAAVREAPILMLDEPTASLDGDNARLVREAIRNISAERICFVISHDLSTVRSADRIVVMNNGRIIEQGSHEELMRLDGEYAAMHRDPKAPSDAMEVIDAGSS